jgi:hypothetical protein
MGDISLGRVTAPDRRCIPIPLVLCLFQVVFGNSEMVHEVSFGKESLSGSLSMSSMEHKEGMVCLGKRSGEIGGGGSDLSLFLRDGELNVSQGNGYAEI